MRHALPISFVCASWAGDRCKNKRPWPIPRTPNPNTNILTGTRDMQRGKYDSSNCMGRRSYLHTERRNISPKGIEHSNGNTGKVQDEVKPKENKKYDHISDGNGSIPSEYSNIRWNENRKCRAVQAIRSDHTLQQFNVCPDRNSNKKSHNNTTIQLHSPHSPKPEDTNEAKNTNTEHEDSISSMLWDREYGFKFTTSTEVNKLLHVLTAPNGTQRVQETRKYLSIQNNKRNVIQVLQDETVGGIHAAKAIIFPRTQYSPSQQQPNQAIDIQYRKEDWKGKIRPNSITDSCETKRNINRRFHY